MYMNGLIVYPDKGRYINIHIHRDYEICMSINCTERTKIQNCTVKNETVTEKSLTCTEVAHISSCLVL